MSIILEDQLSDLFNKQDEGFHQDVLQIEPNMHWSTSKQQPAC
jgi:hypothetical protein